MRAGDLIKISNDKVARLCGSNPGLGLIVDVGTNMVKVQFFSESRWQGQVKPLAKTWVEVV
jgi:hypothetical protein